MLSHPVGTLIVIRSLFQQFPLLSLDFPFGWKVYASRGMRRRDGSRRAALLLHMEGNFHTPDLNSWVIELR